MMIITTKRSSLGYTTDAAMTGVAWLTFLYLFTHGVLALAAPDLSLPDLTFPGSGRYRDALTALATFTVPGLFGMVCWHVARERITRGAMDPGPVPNMLDQETLATHFQLSGHQLDDVQHSRVTVIYHSGEGRIDRLETDGLKLQSARVTPLFNQLRVA